ncbi:MAG: hypothetical protein QOK16_749 [Solirubrobacteraceae bacterium]|jgi:hypothetical protein|nr:hypothetical protein [Solirubrobacteraceae bacterium]MEA2181221.1 hypothetical protein [Solirubrobacteraceae bacterium]MEA2185738.1 hypothetical protein [Solirubrobacteraceae bacterium]
MLVFQAPFDEYEQTDARDRGYVGHASVRTAPDATYKVTFYDTVRLPQDLEYEIQTGRMCIADPGLIVLPEVTLENMETAVRHLFEEGYFDDLKSLEKQA